MATKKQNTTRGHAYELTAKGVKELTGSKGQQDTIFKQLRGKQLTAAELTKRTQGKIKTKQDVGLVVGFYLTTWKADGLVRFAKKAAKGLRLVKKAAPAPTAVSA